MIGITHVIATLIIIVVVVVLLAIALGGVALSRSRRRSGGTTTAAPVAPPTPPPQAPPATVAQPEAPPAAAPVAAPPAAEPEAPGPPPSYRSRLQQRARSLQWSGGRAALGPHRRDHLGVAGGGADPGRRRRHHHERAARRPADQGAVQGDQQQDHLLEALGASIRQLLDWVGSRELRFDGRAEHPDVWLFVGVNGVGKTTTIGKVARREAAAGHSVLLAAGDTFRAAAADQLAMWADRTGARSCGAPRRRPSAIVFDAVQRAAARKNDLVLADTAGRLHTKVNLVEELKKIRRIADRDPGNVTEVLLVLDATTGQNGLIQARQFADAVDVTGIVLTKLDGTAKGGIVVAVERELFVPVKLVGLGEGPDDLVDFDPAAFVDALLASD